MSTNRKGIDMKIIFAGLFVLFAVSFSEAQVATTFLPKSYSQMYKTLDLDETEEEVKSSSAFMTGYFLHNAAASTRYFKLYAATAANVTVGTTVPKLTIPLVAGGSANIAFGDDSSLMFANGLTIACTTGIADNDTGAPGSNECVADIYYK